MAKRCTWPFHFPACDQCREWDTKYHEGVDLYLKQLDELKEERRAKRRDS